MRVDIRAAAWSTGAVAPEETVGVPFSIRSWLPLTDEPLWWLKYVARAVADRRPS